MPTYSLPQSPFGHLNRARQIIRKYYGIAARTGLSRKPDRNTHRPLFVIGSGRSGNTLVRRVLLASSQIYIPPETYVMGDILETWPRTAGLEWGQKVWLFCAYFEKHKHFSTFGVESLNAFAAEAVNWSKQDHHVRALFNGFYQFLAKKSGSRVARWGEKSPWNVYHLPAIGYNYPNACYLWLVRDGRDAALSYAEAGLYPDLATSAVRWTEANSLCATFAGQKFDVRQQRYEDLVSDPEIQFREIFEWAGLDFDPEMLNQTAGPMGDVEALKHHANVARPISASSVGRWKKFLAKDELLSMPVAFHEQLQTLGYDDADSVS